jgi:hypothetical protein
MLHIGIADNIARPTNRINTVLRANTTHIVRDPAVIVALAMVAGFVAATVAAIVL